MEKGWMEVWKEGGIDERKDREEGRKKEGEGRKKEEGKQ